MVILRFLSIFSVFAICPTPAELHGSMALSSGMVAGFCCASCFIRPARKAYEGADGARPIFLFFCKRSAWLDVLLPVGEGLFLSRMKGIGIRWW